MRRTPADHGDKGSEEWVANFVGPEMRVAPRGLMRSAVLVVLTTLVSSILVVAQKQPRVEIFGGYSLERIAPCGLSGSGCNFEGNEGPLTGSFNGWNAAVTSFFWKSMGVTADFAGHYGSTNRSLNPPTGNLPNYTYLFGPEYAIRLARITPFVHGLVGGVSWRSPDVRYNALAWAAGGGLDVKASPRIAIRPVQFDYQGNRVPIGRFTLATGWRYSLGAVFKF